MRHIADNTGPSAVLAAAAFGEAPGAWPLPTAATAQQRWLRAVAAGGQGRYASARADLAALLHDAPRGPLASLAHSTHGSFLRQLGWHERARGFDGRALALAGDHAEAAADALIGLAADALGVGRFAAAATLLDRCAELPELPARLAVRRSWVAAELAMARGDGATAVQHAGRAVRSAPATASARHRVKSEVVLAAALCCAGDLEAARTVGDAALQDTGRLELIPLRWALACLLADIGSPARPDLAELRDACADRVRRGGGAWRPR